jgi:tetratricopeptide (TPR) repeat protein
MVRAAEGDDSVDPDTRARYLAGAEDLVIKLLARDEAAANVVKGHVAAANGDVPGAIAAMEKAVSRRGTLWGARLALASLLLSEANAASPKEADKLYARAIEQYEAVAKSGTERTYEAEVGVATVALRKGDVDRAATQATAMIEKRPNDVGAILLLAECRLRQGKAQEVLALCTQARGINPSAFTAGLTGIARVRLGDLEQAQADLTIAVRTRRRNPRLHYMLGYALEKSGKKEGALTHYALALERAPQFAAARLALARLHCENERWDEARRQLAVLVAAAPKTRQALAGLSPEEREVFSEAQRLSVYATHSEAGGDVAEMEKVLEQVETSREGGVFWAVQAAAVKLRQGKSPEAAKILADAAKQHPRDPEIWLALGKTLLSLARIPEGEAAMRHADALLPRSAVVHRSRAQAYLHLGRRDLAVREYKRALEKEPKDLASRRDLAGVYLRLSPSRAIKIFQEIHNENPESMIDALNLIGGFAASGQVAEAAKLGESVAEKFSGDPRVRALLVVLYKRTNRSEEAEGHLAKMVEMNPGYVPGYELALLQIADGRYQEADALLEKGFAASETAKSTPHLLVYQSVAKQGLGEMALARESLYRIKVRADGMQPGRIRQRLYRAFARHATLVYCATGNFQRAREIVRELDESLPATSAKRMLQSVADLEANASQAPALALCRRRVLILREGGWPVLAEKEAERAVELAPASTAGRLLLGAIQMGLRKYDEASRTLEAIVAIRPSARAYATLGDIAYRRQQFREATYAYTKAVELDDGECIPAPRPHRRSERKRPEGD